jgi:hypothetical protein
MPSAPDTAPSERRDPHTAKFSGPITGVAVPSLVQLVHLSRETGVLLLREGRREKAAYVREGEFVFARSNDPDDRLGELFLRRGLLTMRGLERVTEEVAHTGRRLGGLLVSAGLLTPQELIEGVKEQVREIILSMFRWTRGDYSFLLGALPTEEAITLRVDTCDLIRTGIQRIGTWSRIREAVGGLSTRYQYNTEFDEPRQEMTLERDEDRLLQFLARPATVGEACDSLNANNFEVCRMIWAFQVMGALMRLGNSEV